MTWSRAALCWLAAVLCAALYLAIAPRPAGPVRPADAPPSPAPGAARGYELDPASLARVEVRRGDASVVLERDGERWRVAAPRDRAIPAGLVQAFVEQLVDSGRGERIGENARDPAFGLATPELSIEVTETGGGRLDLTVGARTPAGTAAYALVEPRGTVVLVGLNLLYYANLLFG
jgi:hypothetical protein